MTKPQCRLARPGSLALSASARRARAVVSHLVPQPCEAQQHTHSDDEDEDDEPLPPAETYNSIPGPHRRWSFIEGKDDPVSYRYDNHWYMCEMHDKYGDLVKINRDGHDCIFVRSSDSVRRVLTEEDDFSKTFDADDVSSDFCQYLMNIMQPLLKEAEVFGSADNAGHRAMLKRCFQSSEEFMPGFAGAIDRALSKKPWPQAGDTAGSSDTGSARSSWGSAAADPSESQEAGTDRVDVLQACHLLTFEAVMVLIMGENTSYVGPFYDECNAVLQFFEQRYSKPMFSEEQRVATSINKDDDEVMAKLNEKGLAVVREFKRKVADGTQVLPGQSQECFDHSMLALMLEAGNMSEEEMSATMINTLLAASEGPAAGLSLILTELMNNADVQQKLANELAAAAATSAGSSSSWERQRLAASKQRQLVSTYDTLPYLTGTVLEGLRLYSPVTLVQRQTLRDTQLDGHFVPKGTVCCVCIAAVHRDEAQFVNNTLFDPERQHLNYTLLKEDACFMTFSGGPRGCPGKYLAITIMKQALAKIIGKYNLMPAEQPKDVPGKVYKFVEWNVGGLFINLTPRYA